MLFVPEMCCLVYNRRLGLHYGGEHNHTKLSALPAIWRESDENLRSMHCRTLLMVLNRLFFNLKRLDEQRKRGKKSAN